MRRMLTILLLGLVGLSPDRVAAQPEWSADLAAKVDSVFASMARPDSPGCALGITRDGRLVYARGYGMANLDHDVPITPSTPFHAASISKHVTAAAILLLAQDHKLALDDDVRRYIPEVPDFGHTITLRHLLHHTSGLRDQWELLILSGWRFSQDLITDKDVLTVVARQKALNFVPGSEHLYCNTGYTLLAIVVSRVSGQSLRQFTTTRLFAPLGMTRTFFRDDHADIVKGQAYGYVPAGTSFKLALTNFDTAGATSLHTTVEDLARWEQNFLDPRVGGPALVDALTTRGTLSSGEVLGYASGLTIGTYRTVPTVSHSGADAGYRAYFFRFPRQRVSISCLCNLASADPSALARQVADLYLGDSLGPNDTPIPDSRPAITVKADALKRADGLYWRRNTDTFRRLALRDGALLAMWGTSGMALKPVAPDLFAGRTIDFRIDVQPDGRKTLTETVRGGSAAPVVLDAVDIFEPTASQRRVYVGSYASDEIDGVYRVDDHDGQLWLVRPKYDPEALEPLVTDIFRSPLGMIRFARDAAGKTTGFSLNMGRARGIRFVRREEGCR